MSKAGFYTPNVDRLFNAAANAADDFGTVTQSQTPGPFGQGIPDPVLYEVLADPSDGYDDVVTPQGRERFLDTGSGFIAADPLDTDTLTQEPDGTLRLTQMDGHSSSSTRSMSSRITRRQAGSRPRSITTPTTTSPPSSRRVIRSPLTPTTPAGSRPRPPIPSGT